MSFEHRTPTDALPENTISRGVFLKRAFGLVAGFGAIDVIAACDPVKVRSLASKNNSPNAAELAFAKLRHEAKAHEHHITLPGENISWPFPVHINDDWSVDFDTHDARDFEHSLKVGASYMQMGTNNTLPDVQLGPIGTPSNEAFFNSSEKLADSALTWRVRPALTTEGAPDQLGKYFDAVLFRLNGPTIFDSSGMGHVTTADIVAHYRLNWYRGQEKRHSLIDPARETCVSEVPIDPSLYNQIDEWVKLFRKATINTQSVIFVPAAHKITNSTQVHEGEYDVDTGIAFVSDFYLQHAKIAKLVTNHELGHGIYETSAVDHRTKAGMAPFNKAYNRLFGIAEHEDPKNYGPAYPCNPHYLPVFALFDESNELGHGMSCDMGHPGDAATELFASGLNVMRLQPETFIQKFEALDAEQKIEARNVISGIVQIIKNALAVNNQPASVFDQLLPAWQQITQL